MKPIEHSIPRWPNSVQVAQNPVIVARREGLYHDSPTETTIEKAFESLTYWGLLRKGQRGDPFLNMVRSTLLRGEIEVDNHKQLVKEEHLLHDDEFLWHAPLGKVPVFEGH